MHLETENFNQCHNIIEEMATLNEDDNGNTRISTKNIYNNANKSINNNNNETNNSNSKNNNNTNINSVSSVNTKRDFDTNSLHNNNNDDAKSTKSHNLEDPAELKLKKQALEQRKLELEKLLNEKSWLLQQIQKTETQILSGTFEYGNININDLLTKLAQDYKQEQVLQQQKREKNEDVICGSSVSPSSTSVAAVIAGAVAGAVAAAGAGVGVGVGVSSVPVTEDENDSAILRRKHVNRDNLLNNNLNNNRNSEVSNRSSEYDNYPTLSGADLNFISGNGNNIRNPGTGIGSSSVSLSTVVAQEQMPIKSALKKRSTPTPTPGNVNFLQMHRQQHLVQQQILFQQQQQRQFQQQPTQAVHFDAISLYSVNSANVATLRQQQVAPQQQPIIVQCDKYYLSPTHQNFNDGGGFIRSSQNIKQYVSPLNSPKHYDIQYHLSQHQQQNKMSPMHHHLQQQQQLSPLHSQRSEQRSPIQHLLAQQSHLYNQHTSQQQQQLRHLDAISLAPSYISVDSTENMHQTRWRSQSHLATSQQQHNQQPTHLHHQHSFHHTSVTSPIMISTERDSNKSHSSDMLATSPYYASPIYAPPPPIPSASTKPKPLDEISISSVNSDTQKKNKPKQWLESSLDGPIIRSTPAMDTISTTSATNLPNPNLQKVSTRDRGKLSSQSMSAAGRHYSVSSVSREHNAKLIPSDSISTGNSKLIQDDEGRYTKLSQSTSYLNKMENAAISAPYVINSNHEIATFKYFSPKISISSSKALPSSSTTSASAAAAAAAAAASVSGTTSGAPLAQRNTMNTPQPPPPRPPPLSEKLPPPPPPVSATSMTSPTPVNSPLSPDIRIESPKNMTVVQQATFQPYKEVTKPFEMSDFYKYSTKFRQKENTNAGTSFVSNNNNLGNSSLANNNID